MRILSLLLFLVSSLTINSQELLKNKLEGCHLSTFCLDCGEPRADVKVDLFRSLLGTFVQDKSLELSGKQLAFQVLIDSAGQGCAISYEGNLSSAQATLMAAKLSQFKGWTPALDKGKTTNASIILIFDFSASSPRAGIHRFDPSAQEENMNNPGKPEIVNTTYQYKNKNLKDYEFTVWTKGNSAIPYDMSRAITVDNEDVVWHGTDNALVRFHNDKMEVFNKANSVFKTNYKFMTVSAAATDKKNVKYFAANSRIYTYDGNNWQVFDSAKVGISDVISITAAPNGKIYIGSFDGLLVHEAGKWELLTTANSKLPSNHVRYANTDTKGRTWMGTNGGSLMIEKDGKVVALNETKTPLSNLCITDMMEDREGNLWFASYDYKEKRAEKLVKLDNSENWLSYDVHNSGLPGTIINKIISDKHQDVLWLSVQNVGLVRFDKKADWQVYTNQNSGVPSTYIFDMEQDSKGNLWCATFSGLLRVAKKK